MIPAHASRPVEELVVIDAKEPIGVYGLMAQYPSGTRALVVNGGSFCGACRKSISGENTWCSCGVFWHGFP